MVHGQAIGIPFRRRKGEQAPPPPKEVAWNPTIESNLPYKEVKYFKFVEGAGWQALNIGEILPVGQRVMIRIVTTEPYYEVSKAVSSQMTGIQIGKNGVSEYDIVGTLTVYSPQILTVTIGVDKNYVQWNPVVESNAEYQVVDFYIDTYPAVVGNYYLISSKLRVAITTKEPTDEVTSLTVNGVSFGAPSINGNRFTFNGTLPDKSPQNINIVIDEYIRLEDIDFSAAYPFVPLLQGISWGDKLKVGDEVTYIGFRNILPDLYIRTGEMKLNDNNLVSNSPITIEKVMKFEIARTYLKANEPNCILSNQILPIPNSSYKYLGYQPDLSGHGNHGVFNNFEFAGMSGANGYTEQTFSNWRYNTAEKRAEFTISNDVKLNIAKVVMARGAILYTLIGDYTTNSIQRYKVTGVDENHPIVFGNDAPFDALLTVTTDGEYEVDWKTYGKNPCIFTTWTGDCNITIEQIGEYEGAICFNGVNNYMTIPTLSKGGKQVLMKVNWQNDYDVPGYMYDSDIGEYRNYISKGNKEQIAYENASKTYIDGILNLNLTSGDLKDLTHNVTSQFIGTSNAPYIGCRYSLENFLKLSLFAFMSFPEISEEEEIKDLNDIVGITGGYVERPENYWDCFGKTNDDPDRDAITEQVSKDVANALSVKNADFKLDNGFGKYEVDFASLDHNNSTSVITVNYKSCLISKIEQDGAGNILYSWGQTLAAINSTKIQVTGLDEIGAILEFTYLDESGSSTTKQYSTDGIYDLPASAAYQGDSFNTNFRISIRGYIGDCDITIAQIPEYQNGFVFNGKAAYLENLNIPAVTDFTAIAKRVWVDKDNPMNECFIHKGVVSTPISESAFMLEYEITNDTYYRSASFGGYINVERVNRPESITYQTTESYNGIPIIKGSGIDTKGLVIGAVTNNYWKGIFYKLMLYSKTIDMLSINALKNLFALDILIDINHPIFKK